MGKTVESYRMALESEINRWNSFARALRLPEREAFKELMDMSRSTVMAAGNACNPILFEPMVMSILLAHLQKIMALEKSLGINQQLKGIPELKQPLQIPLFILEKNNSIQWAFKTLLREDVTSLDCQRMITSARAVEILLNGI